MAAASSNAGACLVAELWIEADGRRLAQGWGGHVHLLKVTSFARVTGAAWTGGSCEDDARDNFCSASFE